MIYCDCAVTKQVVHHLFPNICHTHYPAIAPIVIDTCREFEIPYKIFPNVRALDCWLSAPLSCFCLQ